MKNLYEHMVTAMVMILMMFAFTSVLVGEMQIVNARRIHTAAINALQASYYTVPVGERSSDNNACVMSDVTDDQDTLNHKICETFGPAWYLEVVDEGTATATRKDLKVILHYVVKVPIFGIKKDGQVTGYVR